MLEEPTTTATLAEPTAIWFDTHYDSKSSGLYCIEQIKAYVLDDDNAFEVDQWRDADLVHLNTIPFRRRDVGVWRSSKPMVVTQHGGYHWWRSRRDLLERPDHPDLHAHASDIQTHVPPAPADRFQYRVHQATRGRQGRRAGRPDASDPARSERGVRGRRTDRHGRPVRAGRRQQPESAKERPNYRRDDGGTVRRSVRSPRKDVGRLPHELPSNAEVTGYVSGRP